MFLFVFFFLATFYILFCLVRINVFINDIRDVQVMMTTPFGNQQVMIISPSQQPQQATVQYAMPQMTTTTIGE
jgi:subtilisin-like proprotein convertase family protein